MRWCCAIAVACAGFGILSRATAQTNPTDLPPSPFSLPAKVEPQSASYAREAARAQSIYGASTNAEVQRTLGEIRNLSERLAITETNVWQTDPLLLTCDRYIEQAHDWVTAKHDSELATSMIYFHSTNAPTVEKSLRNLESNLSRLTDMILFKELGSDTNFAPLVKAVYDIFEQVNRLNTNSTSRLDIYSYWRFDKAIGFQDTNRPTGDLSFTNLHAEISKRYNLLLAKLAQIEAEQNLPPDVVAGLKYGDLYRTLDGMCEIYLEVRTPPEIKKMRETLQRKLIDLSQLEKSPTHSP